MRLGNKKISPIRWLEDKLKTLPESRIKRQRWLAGEKNTEIVKVPHLNKVPE